MTNFSLRIALIFIFAAALSACSYGWVQIEPQTSIPNCARTKLGKAHDDYICNFTTKVALARPKLGYIKIEGTPDLRPGLESEIFVLLNSAGELVELSVAKSSGQADIDRWSMEKIELAAPFGPVPKSMLDRKGHWGIYWTSGVSSW